MEREKNLELFKVYFPYVALLAISWSLRTKDAQMEKLNEGWRNDKDTMIKVMMADKREQYHQYEKLIIVTNAYLKLTNNEDWFVDNTTDTLSNNSDKK